MGLSEKEVFLAVVDELEERDFEFFVDCNYNSINSRYKSHNIVIQNSIPDIIGFSSDNSVVAIEVKGSKDLKRGQTQSTDYNAGANFSYLAADEEKIRGREATLRNHGVGVIGVEKDGKVNWDRLNPIAAKTSLPEIRAQLDARVRGLEPFSKITTLDLTHPSNFLAPCLYLEKELSYGRSMPKSEFEKGFSETYPENITGPAIEGASVLGLIKYDNQAKLTDAGRLGLVVLKSENIQSISDLRNLKKDTSNSVPMFQNKPLLGLWMQDQYRKHPEFDALYHTLRTFTPERAVTLTEISKRLIRDHPNTFLRLFCTSNPDSREQARRLIVEGKTEKIFEKTRFKTIIRQNLIQNFVAQLKHIGVLSTDTSSTAIRLEDYDPDEYPWYPCSKQRDARLTSFN